MAAKLRTCKFLLKLVEFHLLPGTNALASLRKFVTCGRKKLYIIGHRFHKIYQRLTFKISSKWAVDKTENWPYLNTKKGFWIHLIHFCSGPMNKKGENFHLNLRQCLAELNETFSGTKISVRLLRLSFMT